MTIGIAKETESLTMKLGGRLDTTTAPELEKAFEENMDVSKDLILDMKELEYISSAGLRVLLTAQKKMNQSGKMKLTGVSDEVMEVFEITGFSDILTIE
ncbi:MAG: STAS domain-containing protein [Lachnospiraceae bacterium]|nr:STAS domain-containing protein [Lachnospiraceae bacterium]